MPEKGYLQIGVYEPGMMKPVTDANVQISRITGETVEVLKTDLSGQTPAIELEAPPIGYSMEESGPKPYREYTATISTGGETRAVVEGIQIFGASTALQNIGIPAEAKSVEWISVPEPVLYGSYPKKIPEEEIKPLPPDKGFVVLPDPVVPEYVIVHDGRPEDASAPNYTVPFKDYIKNVTSCEIYSTWPASTITANVLAILSFTLNRIYTEWYAGKGYNFTITSSTAFDHAFSYGRTIYKEISVIVDEMFTSFVTREGIRQPLFTQYCDGRKVSCPGHMTQWGSKDLGDDGMSAMNILKYFYGQDIFLMQAQKVEGIPTSFPGNLQTGSSGENVRTIQRQLNAVSNNFPAIQKQRVDGVFGPATREAVETFQRAFQLPVTGIVDFGTWYRISDVFVAVTRISD